MRKLILVAALVAVLAGCGYAQRGGISTTTAKAETLYVRGTNVLDTLNALRVRIASLLDGTYAVPRATLADSSLGVDWGDVDDGAPRTVLSDLADTSAALRNQLNVALQQAAALYDTLVRLRSMDSLAYSYADQGFEISMGYIGELQSELAAEKASTVSRFAVATDSITALRVRVALLQAQLENGDTATYPTSDRIAPNAVADLVASGGAGKMSLAFTAPNANPGNAASYDIRYSTATITEYGDSGSASSPISLDSLKSQESTSTVTSVLYMGTSGAANGMFVAVTGGYDWNSWTCDSVVSSISGRFTQQAAGVRLDQRAEIWTLDEPGAGYHTITFYYTGTPKVVAGVYKLSNVSAVRTTASGEGVAWPYSTVTIPSSVTGEFLIDIHSLDPDIASATWGAGQTQGFIYYAGEGVDACGASSYRDGASGSVTMTLNYLLNGEDYASAAIALSAVTGGSASTAWANATQYENEPTPKAAGVSEAFDLTGLAAGTYYVAMRSSDVAGNSSAISNVDSAIVTAASPYAPADTAGWRGGYGVAYADSVLDGTYWVDRSGGVGGDGSFGNPFNTIAGARAVATSGDTIVIRAGTYPETIALKSGVTFTNYAKEAVTVTGNGSGDHYFATASSVTNCKVQGIKFAMARVIHDDWQNYNYHVDISQSSGVTFQYCDFRQELEDCNAQAFRYVEHRAIAVGNNSERFTLNGCYLTGWSHSLVMTAARTDTSFFWIKNNHFAKQSWCAIIIGWDTVGAGFHTPAILVDNNLIENTWGEDGIQWQPYYGTAAEQATPRHFKHLVRNNVFRDNAENGIDLKATGHVRVEDNYFYRISGVDDGWFKAPTWLAAGELGKSGGAFEVGAGDTSKHVVAHGNIFYSNAGSFGSQFWPGWKAYNNTMINNRRGIAGDTTNNCSDISHWGVAYGNAVKNNALVNDYVYVQSSASNSALDIDYNLYYQTTGTPLFSYYASGWQEIAGLALWQGHFASGVLGKDAHSLQTAPSFTSVPNYPTGNHTLYDFTPAGGSPLIDAGGPLTTASAGGTGSTSLTVGDAYYFRDAMGMSAFGVVGDSIQIAATSPVGITAVNYATNVITLSSARTWNTGDGVYLFRKGKKWDDIGAVQR